MSEKNIGGCECFHGTPYIDANGQCRCSSGVDSGPLQTVNAPPRPPMMWPANRGNASANSPASAASDNTILGLPPLAVLAIAGVGIYLLSKNDKGAS